MVSKTRSYRKAGFSYGFLRGRASLLAVSWVFLSCSLINRDKVLLG